jgi:hypothetical protein
MRLGLPFLLLSLTAFASLLGAAVPVISSASQVEAVFGEPFSYTIKAEGALGYSVQGLPFWLERKGATLRGVPLKPGLLKLELRALNMDGTSEPFILSIKVKKPVAPQVTDSRKEAISKTE